MGFGSRRPTRLLLLNARYWAACLAVARDLRDWRLEDWKRVPELSVSTDDGEENLSDLVPTDKFTPLLNQHGVISV
ncbi:hypothetical protein TNCV_2786341 [Trichonephila clavipes]|nr:hypothetical protein TNCV_2786341 [Trichonephila clavipes]